jgi:PEGA domain
MQKRSIAVALVLVMLFAAFGVLTTSGPARPAAAPTVGPNGPIHVDGRYLPMPAASAARPSDAPSITFPRTIMVESYTAMWCPHCPSESQALRNILANASPGTLINPELHFCAEQDYCGDDYIASDNIEYSRLATEDVTGFPTVIIDGGPYSSTEGYGYAGSCAESESAQTACIPLMQSLYQNAINNQTAWAGNVSITQQGYVSVGGDNTVSVVGNITSGISGTYQAVTYLVQHIGHNTTKYDAGNLAHYIGDIVWRALVDENVTLTAGAVTPFSATKPLNASWDLDNLSVVTFVQQNSTILPVENANQSEISTASVTVTPGQSPLSSRGATTVDVKVVNGTTGAPVVGAAVVLSELGGGSFTTPTGVTGSGGLFSTSYVAPTVTGVQYVRLTADVSGGGVLPASTATLLQLQPTVAPGVPTAVALVPAGISGQVELNWSAPLSGGAGLTYHVYRSTSTTGTFAPLAAITTTNFTDDAAASGQTYWYTVSAQGPGGFSLNTSAVEASPVTVGTSGLPTPIGWWLSIDSLVFNSTTNASINLHLVPGNYPYTDSSSTFNYLSNDASDTLVVAGVAQTNLTILFNPNYGTLNAKVSPTTATVLFNGTSVQLQDGAFSEVVFTGTFQVHVSAPGYADNNTSVTVTDGNVTTLTVKLVSVSSSPSGASPNNGGLSPVELVGLIGIFAVVVIGTIAAVVLSRRNRSRGGPPSE